MRIAVCDDEAICRKQLSDAVDSVAGSLDIVTYCHENGRDFLKSFRENPCDLIFLDIEMPEMDGITVAREIRKLSNDVPIVFLTAHIEYALEGYEVNALRYLTKPVQQVKLKEILDHVSAKMQAQRVLWLKTDMGEERVPLADILFFEAQNQNVLVHTSAQDFTVRYNISDYEAELGDDGFFRIHRGYIVSLRRIKRVDGKEVTLDDGTSLPVSRTKEKELRDALFRHVREAAI